MLHKFESRHQPLLSRRRFARRIARHLVVSAGFMGVSLLVGMIGYHALEGMNWIDSFLNAAMILGGMGPIEALHTNAGRIFAGCYALYSGLGAVILMGFLAAPLFHRVLHQFHLEQK